VTDWVVAGVLRRSWKRVVAKTRAVYEGSCNDVELLWVCRVFMFGREELAFQWDGERE